MSKYDYLPLLLETKECFIYELPFFDKNLTENEWRLTVEWKDEKGKLYNDSFQQMIDFYPIIYEVLSEEKIINKLSWKFVEYMNNDLRVHVELPPSKEVSKAYFIEFLDRVEPLRRIGIVISAKLPENRLSFEWMIDEYAIAEVAHIDFDKFKEWKPKKGQNDEQYIRDTLLKGTRGNIGEITHVDKFRILIRKSKEGIKYAFAIARNKYLELLLKDKQNQLQQREQQLKIEKKTQTKILDTLLGDLGYEGSKYLHSKYKISRRRPTIGFSDDLYKKLKAKLIAKYKKNIDIKRRGRYYHIGPLDLAQAAFLFDESHVVVSFNEDPPYDLYMGDIGLLYNQINHSLALKFTRTKRTKLKRGQNVHM